MAELVAAATKVFIALGYRRTQMSDVAAELGVAKGTLYLYVESKEALFDLALRHADRPEEIAEAMPLPIPTPPAASTLAYVRKRMAAEAVLPSLQAALERRRVADAAAELEEIVRELFAILSTNRRAIKLIDRSAVDHPDLAELWFRGARGGALATLEEYLRKRIRGGKLRDVPDVVPAARLIVETVSFWAVHRYWDAHPQQISDDTALETIVRFIVGALRKE